MHARIISSDNSNMVSHTPIDISIKYSSEYLDQEKIVTIIDPEYDCYTTQSESGCSKNIGLIQNNFKEGSLVIKALDEKGLLAYIEYEDGKVISKEESVPGRDF